mmetsp:Transcript_89489/g.253568  ORF Transcript_89489/g.253568 Transcript_89489/m.253568 type:complete len:404 (-) Transcript_89489:70-1281(-)
MFSFVGQGGNEYTQQGTYRYIGMGARNIEYGPPAQYAKPHMAPVMNGHNNQPPQQGHGKGESSCPWAGALASVAVLLYTGISYNVFFLGRILPELGRARFVALFFLMFNIPWCLAMLSYYKASQSDPGYVPVQWKAFVQGVGDALPIFDAQPLWSFGKATHCERCRVPRPERAHHCKVCNVCVMRMDHHCQWINNCVGLYNHKYFLQLAFYGALASLAGIVTCLPELIYCIVGVYRQDGTTLRPDLGSGSWGLRLEPVEYKLGAADTWIFLSSILLGLVVGVLLALLLTEHLQYLVQNMSTIETNYPRNLNPFDLGEALPNAEQALGECGLDWCVPVAPWKPMSDGIVFSLTTDRLPGLGNRGDTMMLWRRRYGVRPPPEPPMIVAGYGSGHPQAGMGPHGCF